MSLGLAACPGDGGTASTGSSSTGGSTGSTGSTTAPTTTDDSTTTSGATLDSETTPTDSGPVTDSGLTDSGLDPTTGDTETDPGTSTSTGDGGTDTSTSTGAVGECEPGATEPCYSGPANTLGVGACVEGERTCTDGMWSECIGEVVPALESCNSGADEDCDGESPCGGFAWSRAFTGAAVDTGWEVGFDGAGNVVVVARGNGGLDFGGGLLAGAGQNDLFVARFAPDGEHLWSKRFGDAFEQFANEGGVAVAPGGDIVVGGEFKGTLDFGGGPLVAGVVSSGFVAKLAADGSHVWSRAFVGAEASSVVAVGVDAQGAAVIGGGFLGTNDFGGGALLSAGSADAFVAKFTAAGTPVWSKRFGDAQAQSVHGIDATPAGGACVGGNFYGAIDLGDGPLTSVGDLDGFFGCFDPQGAPQWSRSFGSSSADEVRALAIGGDGRVHVAGHTLGIVDLGGGPLGAQKSRGLLAQYEADGAHVWSRLASTGNSYVQDLAVDGLGAVLATGGFNGGNDFGGGVLTPFAVSDGFALKLGPDGKYVWARTFAGGFAEVSCFGVAGSATGQVAVTGRFSGKFDIGQGPVQSKGGWDGFVATFAP